MTTKTPGQVAYDMWLARSLKDNAPRAMLWENLAEHEREDWQFVANAVTADAVGRRQIDTRGRGMTFTVHVETTAAERSLERLQASVERSNVALKDLDAAMTNLETRVVEKPIVSVTFNGTVDAETIKAHLKAMLEGM